MQNYYFFLKIKRFSKYFYKKTSNGCKMLVWAVFIPYYIIYRRRYVKDNAWKWKDWEGKMKT